MVGEQMELGLDRPTPRKKRGGKRDGAGRKKTGRCHDSPHRVRRSVTRHQPQHVVLRVRAGLPRLRKGPIYRAIRKAIERTLVRHDFRVVHVSIQHNHLHFLVEADDRRALQLGMQGLAISAAKRINAICGKRKGKVFQHRYHATRISSPRQARHALAYVLNNWRRHDEDERSRVAHEAAIDPFSSAVRFPGWSESRLAAVMPRGFDVEDHEALPVARPTSWLLTIGWRRHGAISVYEVPGPFRAIESAATRRKTSRPARA